MKQRMKNPWFWVGIGGIVLTAMGVDAQSLTSWVAVGQALVGVVTNPVALMTVAMAVLGVFVDPTTDGLGDDHGN